MKIKFDIKSTKASVPFYTIFLEEKDDDNIEFYMTKLNVTQIKLNNMSTAQRQETPIADGLLMMNKAQLKKFINVLEVLVKS